VKLCPSCNCAVPEGFLAEEETHTYAHGKGRREACVLCRTYLPVTYDQMALDFDGNRRAHHTAGWKRSRSSTAASPARATSLPASCSWQGR